RFWDSNLRLTGSTLVIGARAIVRPSFVKTPLGQLRERTSLDEGNGDGQEQESRGDREGPEPPAPPQGAEHEREGGESDGEQAVGGFVDEREGAEGQSGQDGDGEGAAREGGEEEVEADEEEEEGERVVVLERFEQSAPPNDVHAGEGEEHGPERLPRAAEKAPRSAMGDEDAGGR